MPDPNNDNDPIGMWLALGFLGIIALGLLLNYVGAI